MLFEDPKSIGGIEMKVTHKLVLIMPYYGNLPPYFDYWIKSLEGLDFDVIFFTDLSIGEHPDNFRIQKMSLEDLRMLAEKKLGARVNLIHGYKLCDLRPMYGRIFEDYIEGYDYWAFGDCDVVYGRAFNGVLGKLLADSVYDVISFRRWWASGSFCIVRNSFETNTLYLKARNYAQILASPQNEVFDELGGWWHPHVKSGKMSVEECGRLKDNFSAVLWRQEGLSFFHEDVLSEDILQEGEVISMVDGHLYRNDKEIEVFHFVECKTFQWFSEWFTRLGSGPIGNYRITRYGVFCTDFEWRWRNLIGFVRRKMERYKHYKFLLSHAKEVGVKRTVRSFIRQKLGGR